MDGATITDSSFTLEGPGGAVPASVAYDPATRTATLASSAGLAHATTYTARLGTSLTALDGVALGTAVSWTFTTAAAPAPPFRPLRLQLATDPATPWSWRSFVERFSFRSRRPEIWMRLSDGNGTVTEWQRVRFARSAPARSRR